MLCKERCMPSAKERLVTLIVKSAINAYMDWKHPNKLSSRANNSRYIQQRKEDYFERLKMYARQKGKI